MSGLADIWIAILSGALVCAATGLAMAAIRTPLIARLRKVQPALRATILLVVITAPLAMALATATLIALSSHGTAIDLVPHHCHVSAADCVPHAPATPTPVLSLFAGGLLTAVLIWVSLMVGAGFVRTARSLRLLRQASERHGGAAERVLGTDSPVALASGLLRSQLFLSRGLLLHLDASELAIVRAHEESHARRFDNLTRLLASALSLGHTRGSVRALRQELVLAQEQACDRIAADRFGAIETAETLLKVERLMDTWSAETCRGAAFVDAPVTARVKALVVPNFAPLKRNAAWFAATLLAASTGIFLVAEPLHHEVETLILILQG